MFSAQSWATRNASKAGIDRTSRRVPGLFLEAAVRKRNSPSDRVLIDSQDYRDGWRGSLLVFWVSQESNLVRDVEVASNNYCTLSGPLLYTPVKQFKDYF